MSTPSRAEIVACETCGSAQRDVAGRTRGEGLIAELRAALAGSGDLPVDVSSVRCLWACKRSCAVAVRSVSRVGYVIAELEPTALVAHALLDYAARYARSEDGAVPYREWPAALKGHFLCRFPKGADLQSGDSPGMDSARMDSARMDSASIESACIDLGPQNPDELTRAAVLPEAPR
jgi:predicted metal-binding protein